MSTLPSNFAPASSPEEPLDGSVTDRLSLIEEGDDAAAHKLWQQYFERLVRLARRNLRLNSRRSADEEDVALMAFANFWRRAAQGQFPTVRDRGDPWPLLATLTVRMAIDHIRHGSRRKRGGPAPDDPKGVAFRRDRSRRFDAAQIADRQPTPDFLAQVSEECERLMSALHDAELRSIALWKVEGYTNQEIARKLGVVLRTVERKIHKIRQRWAPGDQRA